MGLMGWAQMAAEESALESIGQANPLTERCRDIAPNERHTQVERPACASTEKMRISPIYRAMGSVRDARAVQYHSPAEVQQPFVMKSGASRRTSGKEILHCSA